VLGHLHIFTNLKGVKIMKMKKTIFASNLMMASILIILGSLTVATSAVASNLTIHVENLRSEKG
jgi:uncharacterized protein (DUF2141 family)